MKKIVFVHEIVSAMGPPRIHWSRMALWYLIPTFVRRSANDEVMSIRVIANKATLDGVMPIHDNGLAFSGEVVAAVRKKWNVALKCCKIDLEYVYNIAVSNIASPYSQIADYDGDNVIGNILKRSRNHRAAVDRPFDYYAVNCKNMRTTSSGATRRVTFPSNHEIGYGYVEEDIDMELLDREGVAWAGGFWFRADIFELLRPHCRLPALATVFIDL